MNIGGYGSRVMPENYNRVDNRQERQQKRIDAGIENGSLNEVEQKIVERGQNRIERMEDRFNSDGELSAKEAIRLENAQDRASHQIFGLKHNMHTLDTLV